jgi:hypothetical protein
VPFAGTRIPVLGPVEIAVFKVMFDRTRDWADLEAMIAGGDARPRRDARAALRTRVEADDPRCSRLATAERDAQRE